MASRISESAFNAEFAGALRDRHPRWGGSAVLAEATGVFRGAASRRPDILLTGEVGAPVVIETEYEPARGVESDAAGRLGAIIDATGRAVASVLAVRVPLELRDSPGGRLHDLVSSAPYRFCCYTTDVAPAPAGGPAGAVRFPSTGWLTGGVDEIAGLVERVLIPESAVAQGALLLEHGVNDAAAILDRLGARHTAVLARVAESLRQDDGEQTRRMAMAICANALVFQTAVAGTHPEVVGPSDPSLRSGAGGLSKRRVLSAWQRILSVNYWPIFAVAHDIVSALPPPAASEVLDRLVDVAEDMAGLGAVTTGDLAGQMFGRLISDRKFLATFYTRPASATLLAELAVGRLTCDFGSRAEVTGLRLADLACGTGALLSAAYRAVAARYRRGGGDDEALHAEMMEACLIGADIMPAATHLTASMLSGVHPSVPFGNTRVYTMPYGRQSSLRPAAIGSLELLGNEQVLSLFGTGRSVASGGGERSSEALGSEAEVPDASLDVVIMNPPFTRSTNHEGAAAGVPRPAFAGFDTNESEQLQMAARLDHVCRGLKSRAGHGNAGLASNFIDLADAKVMPGGVVALVLPAAVASGGSWQAARDILREGYARALVVTIASAGSTDRAFSADTGMAEALVVATRKTERDVVPGDDAVVWISLKERPHHPVAAAETARAIAAAAAAAAERAAATDPAEDPPGSDGAGVAGRASGRLQLGDEVIGCYTLGGWGDGGCVGVANPDVIEAAAALAQGALRLPGLEDRYLPLAPLAELGERGPYHLDISGPALSKAGVPRGPFDVGPLPWNEAPPSYPVLWSHDAGRERRLTVEPDSQGTVRPGQRDRALAVWATATRLHISLDFQLNSQSLACCLTPGPAVGGRAWPSYRLSGRDDGEVARREKLAALWMNTTLGLIGFWWLGTRQQQGRAVLTITRLGDLVSADPRRLEPEQIDRASEAFDELAVRDLRPAHEAAGDPVRHRLDEAVLGEILGLSSEVLDRLAVLRQQWCAEPSVHGGKGPRTVAR
ncbi:MAG: hypothetical protein F4110_09565 [Acidimicrobiaceae bacterium]|nr:hypothetical protein [Acidimicrobiaceae bacterium]MXZ98612.1 hypothetical protein [Acidimicrobiaceae bacterium]MYE76959.1 hypothetical protein [Acidimicrobiaceae bacterium]MYE97470.1 hypothetical protein [Acidimicrobiaceae bacterium]MYI54210.1 hypothetical protein [Acidimicrobiaceae bacterium]